MTSTHTKRPSDSRKMSPQESPAKADLIGAGAPKKSFLAEGLRMLLTVNQGQTISPDLDPEKPTP